MWDTKIPYSQCGYIVLKILVSIFRCGFDGLRLAFGGRWEKFFTNWLCAKTGIWIQARTQIGYGLYIGHGIGLVVNPTARIGNNCNLSQFMTIGANDGKAAVIGDNVYIGPSVCIVEDVEIGNNATIGAGAVVVKDVPMNATVAGVPAKIISYKSPGRYIGNRWTL